MTTYTPASLGAVLASAPEGCVRYGKHSEGRNINWFNCRRVTIQQYPMNNEASILLSMDCRIGDVMGLETPLKARGPRALAITCSV